jgi:hypothetical protein
MEAPSVADDCSDPEHGHRHTPSTCASKESANFTRKIDPWF